MIALDDWRRLCPSLRVLDLPDSARVYHQGDDCRDAYVIARGHIKLSRVNSAGSENTMIILPAGDICGTSLVDESAQALDTATAKGSTRLYRVGVRQLMVAMRSDERVADFVVRRLATRQAFLERRIEQLLSGDACQRIVSVLVELTGDYGGRCVHGHEIDVRLTQQELAQMAGASRPTVSTVLNRLRALGVVSYTRHYICIESLEALARISSDDIAHA